jgi:murein L,D-transpeptidase YcbB/YkuD
MRKMRADRLLAGTMLALIAITPAISIAAPLPPPPAGYTPPSALARTPEPRAIEPMEPNAQEKAQEPTQIPEARPAPEASFAAADRQLAASDGQITEKLREMISGKQLERRVERAPERKAIEGYYASHGNAPLWIRDGRLTPQAQAVLARFKNAAADGLDSADYQAPDFGALSSAEALADGDIKLTNSVLTYARHLAVGRIAPTRVSAEVDYGNHVPEPADVLRKVADARDVDASLDSFNPPHDGFKALKAKLAELRSNASEPRAEVDNRIPDGRHINPGEKDARVPALRERLHVAGKPSDLTYDRALFNAIKNVQARADIKPTGVIDGKTISAVNGPKPVPPSQQVERVIANMERWRWLPRDLGKTYVIVNIPDYTLKVVRDGGLVWRTKIVAGKPQTPTPLLSASMDNVMVNPSWYVPQSIIQNELLPLYASDPNIFDRMGLEVKRGPDGNINVVQPPGAANALGRIKFNFPNKFQVYLHDTPEKRLFASEKRAFSHGCMRVEDPTKFGEIMLHLAMTGPTPSSQQLMSMFGHEEKIYKLVTHPTVHLTYQTAFVDDGKLMLRDDIYGFDGRINAILHSDERRIADVAPPQDPKRDAATAKSNQEILSRVERREAQNPFSFFERLFR